MDNRNISKALMVLLNITAILAGCISVPTIQPPTQPTYQSEVTALTPTEAVPAQPENTPTNIPITLTPDSLEKKPTQTIHDAQETEDTSRVNHEIGEVPDKILDEIFADLETRTGVERGAFQVVRAEAVTWKDGSLGCPIKGEFYIQALIHGYWVVLEVEGVKYDYRVSDTGHIKLCEGMLSEFPDILLTPDKKGKP